jgi:hypothetical protein
VIPKGNGCLAGNVGIVSFVNLGAKKYLYMLMLHFVEGVVIEKCARFCDPPVNFWYPENAIPHSAAKFMRLKN